MHRLRQARTLARLVLAWFALSLGVAIASPLVQPKSVQLVCSGSGAMKLVVDDGGGTTSSHTLDCPLCASVAPPAPSLQSLSQPEPLAHGLEPIPAARIAAITAAPLPPRGPPASSHA